jgi:hypothetical protein
MIQSTTTTKQLLKDGTTISKGTKVSVSFDQDRPHVARITLPSGKVVTTKAIRLMNFVTGFVRYTQHDVNNAMCDDICPSLRGYDVEPDGWDEEGSPSLLMALSLI